MTCASRRWRQQRIGGGRTAAGGKGVAARRPRRRGGRRLTLEAELGLVAVALDALLGVLAGGAAPDAGAVGGEAPAVHALLTDVALLGALQAAGNRVVGVLLLLHASSAGRSCRRGAGERRRSVGWSSPPAAAAADRPVSAQRGTLRGHPADDRRRPSPALRSRQAATSAQATRAMVGDVRSKVGKRGGWLGNGIVQGRVCESTENCGWVRLIGPMKSVARATRFVDRHHQLAGFAAEAATNLSAPRPRPRARHQNAAQGYPAQGYPAPSVPFPPPPPLRGCRP